jgi:glyoxylase-like metal-dependent hydrolase (beta-lactamase superfamily II)
MSVHIEKFVTGPIETNTYVVVNEEMKCFIVDPSSDCYDVLSYLEDNSIVPETIVITHGHFDHTMGINEILAVYPELAIYIHPGEAPLLRRAELNGSGLMGIQYSYDGPVVDLSEGSMQIGSFNVKIIVVPGHSPAGTAVLIDKYLICGDILFAGSVGRSDLPGGNESLLLKGIKEKFMILPEETVVCPGHGGRTTIAREKKENPYL